jgi:hypothetical protein
VIKGAGGVLGAQIVNATTGAAFSGTVVAYVTGDGGTQAAATNSCTAEGNGYYTVVLTSSETNYDLVAVTFVGTGAIPATIQIVTIAAVPTPVPSTAITGPGVTTALTLITDSFGLLNVFLPGEDIPAADAQTGLRTLNRLIGSWAQQHLTIPSITRTVVDLVANQASYTVGTGGDIDILRPPNQANIQGASLLYPSTTPTVETPLGILTDDGYRLWPLKDATAALPSVLYYNPTVSDTFGTIYLLPIPDNSTYDLALYCEQQLSTFADLSTTYAFPDAYAEALVYNLARRLAKPYGRDVDADLMDMANRSLAIVKRSNFKMLDLGNYFGSAAAYDINSDRIWVR